MSKEKYFVDIVEQGSEGLGKLDYCFNQTTKEFFIVMLLIINLVLSDTMHCAYANNKSENPLIKDYLYTLSDYNLKRLKENSNQLFYNNDNSFKPFNSIVSDAEIVAIGENTHGTHEFILMRNELAQYLIRKCGFTMIAIEDNMPHVAQLNDYILYSKGNARELIKESEMWIWKTEEFLELIEWLRNYNKTASTKAIIAGIDMQSTKSSATIIQDFLKKFNNIKLSQQLNQIVANYNSLIKEKWRNLNLYNPKAKPWKPDQQKFASLTKEIRDFKNELENYHTSKNYKWVQQNLTLIEQGAKSIKDDNYRDRALAENIHWLMQQYPKQKLIFFAHNAHIQKYPAENFYNQGVLIKNKEHISMGQYLIKLLHSKYCSVAFDTYAGNYNVWDMKNLKIVAMPLPAPPLGTLENNLSKIKHTFLLINFRTNSSNDNLFSTPIYWLSLGAIASPVPFVPQRLPKAFDALIFISTTHPSILIS